MNFQDMWLITITTIMIKEKIYKLIRINHCIAPKLGFNLEK